ncbi:deoxyribodipyrimidine photolyase [Brachybacterium endophyticum]|uniref:Deoxyribodipyrimidine photolyase n=1 Tax=Brachybacterium endophyticum TaxID=2182385 RepID=A0A2U2RMW9_9MICO|nr:deoxyribodipyrimidine photo-lyase [Brachybacterium endophyticum]PWH07212.1 deoxyribodipyrimidine photolyase [Brachybacterium endophyticum]
MTSIWWIRDDLRLHDNAALTAAADAGPVIALHIDESVPGARRPGGATRWWLHQSLSALASRLREHGIPLVLADGDPRQVLPALVAESAAGAVHWQRRYHAPHRAVDAEVKTALRENGIDAESHPGHLLHEPWTIRTGQGSDYRVFTPFARACEEAPTPQRPRGVPDGLEGPAAGVRAAGHEVRTWLRAEDFAHRLAERGWEPSHPDWAGGLRDTWTPGEDGARSRLDELSDVLSRYDSEQDRPDREGTSRLSPHLRFGEISVREVWHRSLGRGPHADVRRTGGQGRGVQGKGAQAFRRQLLWRDFAWHRLFHVPTLATNNIRSRFDTLDWREDSQELRAWQHGRTGIPLVDAGMRELWETGFMHNRVRLVVGSFLTKNLRQHWRRGEEWFWDTLVDADEASNPFNWQWVAGSGDDAAPYFRIFNPERQRERFDPDCSYVRRWVPELSGFEEERLEPIVDLAASRRDALAAYEATADPD